jgi:quinol monooxygenase YgiN
VVTVLARINLREGQKLVAEKLYADWCDFLKQKTPCKEFDLVCLTDTQLVWIEKWESKAALDDFNANHFTMSDFAVRMLECSRGAPKRATYQELR